MIEKELLISGMNCGHCVMAVKKELSKLQLNRADIEIGKAKIVFDETKVSDEQIDSAIKEAGFELVK